MWGGGGVSAERMFQGMLSTSLSSGGPFWSEVGWGSTAEMQEKIMERGKLKEGLGSDQR